MTVSQHCTLFHRISAKKFNTRLKTSTEVTPESERKIWANFVPESECCFGIRTPSTLFVYVCAYVFPALGHPYQWPQALYKWYLSKGHKQTKNADTRTTRNAVTWCYCGRWLTFQAIISLLLQLLHATSSFLFKVNTGFYIFNFINLHFYSNIIIIC